MKLQMLFSFVLLVFFTSVTTVAACSCAAPSVCRAYNNSHFVFVGKVVEEKNQILTFEVQENFVGTKHKALLKTRQSAGGGSCGFSFKLGKTYLIYGFQPSPTKMAHYDFGTMLCTRTAEFSEDSADIKFLRGLASQPDGGTVSGKVYRLRWNENEKLVEEPFPNLSVRIKQIGGVFNSILRTNESGEFNSRIPAGEYRITPTIKKSFRFSLDQNFSVKIRNSGCVRVDFEMKQVIKR